MGQLLTYASSSSGFDASLGGMSTAQKAALQAGIWEIVYEPSPGDTFDLFHNTFKVESAASPAIAAMNTLQGWMTDGYVQSLGPGTYQKYAVLYSRHSRISSCRSPNPKAMPCC